MMGARGGYNRSRFSLSPSIPFLIVSSHEPTSPVLSRIPQPERKTAARNRLLEYYAHVKLYPADDLSSGHIVEQLWYAYDEQSHIVTYNYKVLVTKTKRKKTFEIKGV